MSAFNLSRFRFVPSRATAFVSAPASPLPLAVFRMGVAAVLLGQAGLVADDVCELYGRTGVAPWSVCEAEAAPGVPRMSWFASAFALLGVPADAATRLVFLAYVGALVGLLAGWRTRFSATVAWLLHLSLSTSAAATTYGVDQWATLTLFYCVWMPVGDAFSLDARAGPRAGPSAEARLALRVLQLHLCVAYFSSGVEKASGVQWWSGEAVWRAGMRPDLAQLNVEWLASAPWLAMAACWLALVVETGYAVFMWSRRTRIAWAVATIGLHVGIAVMMGLWTFSALMIVLTASAFLVSAEPASQTRENLRSGGQAEVEAQSEV